MPHDERMLKSAFKTSGGKATQLLSQPNRRALNLSQTPYQKKGGHLNFSTSDRHISPDLKMEDSRALMEQDRKFEKSQRRWETVLGHKHDNADKKAKDMKSMLFKKFKREKEMAKNMAE